MKNIIVMALFCISVSAFATDSNDIVQLTADGTSTNESPARARSESLKAALDAGCIEVITKLIGPNKLEKNMSVIRNKVMQQTSKFVQFYKASEPSKRGGETFTSITMKVSISSLRDILGQEGLLYQSEGPATILPLIKIVENRSGGRKYRWWMEEGNPQNAFVRDQSKLILHQFDGIFRSRNFYLIDPISQHYVQWIPEPYRAESSGLEDLMWMGDFFKAQMILFGEAVLSSGSSSGVRLTIKLTAYHTSNGRVVGEVTRSFDNPSSDWDLGVQQVLRKGFGEAARDISTQIFEEWSRGTFGATLMRVSLRGNIGYQDIEAFKKQILMKIGDVKTIRERKLETGNATFEVDAAGGITNLVKRLETTPFEGFKVAVDRLDSSQIELRWSKGQ